MIDQNSNLNTEKWEKKNVIENKQQQTAEMKWR